jgi:hypothetical protein
MQPTFTDDQIRANAAFPELVRVLRTVNWIFWSVLPVFVAFSVCGVFLGMHWALAVAAVLAVGNAGGQVYARRRARRLLAEISSSPAALSRAWRLAYDAAKLRFVRWVPGA